VWGKPTTRLECHSLEKEKTHVIVILIMKANDMHYFSNLFDKVLNQINLRNTASHWLSLYEYITMHVPLNVKNAIVTFCMGTFVKFPFQNRPDIYPPPKKENIYTSWFFCILFHKVLPGIKETH